MWSTVVFTVYVSILICCLGMLLRRERQPNDETEGNSDE
jgi:hypothetical protein